MIDLYNLLILCMSTPRYDMEYFITIVISRFFHHGSQQFPVWHSLQTQELGFDIPNGLSIANKITSAQKRIFYEFLNCDL